MSMPVIRAKTALSEAMAKGATDRRKLGTEVVHVSSGEVNAGARQQSDQECQIVFFAGTSCRLFEACMNVAARMDPTTGTVVKRDGRILVYPGKIDLTSLPERTAQLTADEVSGHLLGIGERGLENAEFGVFLYEIASWFVAMHEVMHVILGHAAFATQRLGLDCLLEFSERRLLSVDPAFSQMLEFSADRNASRGIARRLILGDIDESYEEGLLANLQVERGQFMLRSLITAITVLLHLFPKRYCSTRGFLGSHPHPYTRMQWITMELGHELRDEFDFVATILEPVAEVAASLRCNFVCGDDWWAHAEKDGRTASEGVPPTDLLYERVRDLAGTWREELMAMGPVFDQSG